MRKNYQPSPKVLACRENGRKGGLARAKNNAASVIKEWSSRGGKKTSYLYGGDFYQFIGTRRLFIGRYRKPVVHKVVSISSKRTPNTLAKVAIKRKKIAA